MFVLLKTFCNKQLYANLDCILDLVKHNLVGDKICVFLNKIVFLSVSDFNWTLD